MNRNTAQRSRRIPYVLGVAILLLAPVSGKAANLVDVRVGVHEKYTRVVLETDTEAPYHVGPSSGSELTLDLSAASDARTVASSKSPHLEAVVVGPGPSGGSEIRIALRVPVDVTLMVLREPDRIVMDLVETTGEATPVAGQTAAPVSEPETVAEAVPEPGKTVPEEAPAPEPEPLAEAPAEPAPAEPVRPAATKKREAGAAPAIPEPDPSAVLAAREAPAERPRTPRKPAGSAAELSRRVVKPSPPAAEGGLLDWLPAPLNRPLVLAGLGLGVIFAIVFAALRRKGTAGEEEPITPFAAGEPFSVDEQAEVAGEAESTGQPQDVEPDAEGEESSLFDQPVETEEPWIEEPSDEPGKDREEIAVAPAVEPVPAPVLGEEQERRIAQLEERLEEIIDEKDRLGRQVAAQTEELRVQRAAIARTQRVLRDLARPTDEATEPVLKS